MAKNYVYVIAAVVVVAAASLLGYQYWNNISGYFQDVFSKPVSRPATASSQM